MLRQSRLSLHISDHLRERDRLVIIIVAVRLNIGYTLFYATFLGCIVSTRCIGRIIRLAVAFTR